MCRSPVWTTPQEAPAPFDGKSFTVFWDAYPKKIDREGAWNAWSALRPSPDTAAAILSALEKWKVSSRWIDDNGEYIPHADKFLSKGYWRSPPQPVGSDTSAPKERQLDSDEQAAIRRVLEESL